MLRIIIALRDQLLGEGVRELLHASRSDRIKTHLTNSSSGLEREISYFRPNILILDEWVEPKELQFLVQYFLESADLEMILLLNIHNNRILFFRKQEKNISDIRDLISIIQKTEMKPC